MTHHAETLAALTRQILEEPDDDGLRLILADALRDSDDPADVARGEFVAESMAFARLRSCKGEGRGCWCQACMEWPFMPSVPKSYGDAVQLRWPDDRMAYLPPLGLWRGLAEVWAVADVPSFEREAEAVFRAHPIRRVVLRAWVPGGHLSNWPLNVDHAAAVQISPLYRHLTWPLQRGVRRYPSSVEFRADLESACVRYGRSLAGLKSPSEVARAPEVWDHLRRSGPRATTER